MTYLWQGRVQQHLDAKVDVAGEARWGHRPTASDSQPLIYTAEFGLWLTRDLRVAAGYMTQPWTETGPTLTTTTGRGGPYAALSSRLSSLFDLFSKGKGQ